jgi:hypothetical protein
MTRRAPRSVELIRHQESAPSGVVRRVEAEISTTAHGDLHLRYAIEGDVPRIVVPAPAPAQAAVGLWQHTCFEAFIASPRSTAYCEFNFSPSTEWAAYGFTGYREGMAPLRQKCPPIVTSAMTTDRISVEATVPRETLEALPGASKLRLGIAAVIERVDGGLSYWALTHRGERPDFHDPAGFVLELERRRHP